MAIVSLVLDSAFGKNQAGEIVQCSEEMAEALRSAKIAHDATEEDVAPKDDEGDEDDEKDEGAEGEEGESGDDVVEEGMRNLSTDARNVVLKATQEAVKKLTNSFNRPVVGSPRYLTGSDEKLTGGFKNLGDAVSNYIRKGKGDWEASKKFAKWDKIATKGYMSVSGSSGHAGGDLVPQQWAEDLWKLSFESVPDLLGLMRRYPMENQIMNIPAWVQSAGAAGVQSNVIAEGQDITATEGVTANVQLALEKNAILVNVTDELLRFNSYALESVLTQIAPERIRFSVNNSVINGSPQSGINLVSNATTLTQIAEVAGHISYNDVTGMYAKLFDPFVNGAIWLINQSTSPELFGLGYPNRAATTQFPAFSPGVFAGQNLLGPKPMGELMGLPVYRVENVPGLGTRGSLILWHPQSCAAGYTGLIADRTPYLYFNLAQDTFRFLFYTDSVNPMNVPYTRADGSKASNIVILSAGSTSSS